MDKIDSVEEKVEGFDERNEKLEQSCSGMKDSIAAVKDAMEKTSATTSRKAKEEKIKKINTFIYFRISLQSDKSSGQS